MRAKKAKAMRRIARMTEKGDDTKYKALHLPVLNDLGEAERDRIQVVVAPGKRKLYQQFKRMVKKHGNQWAKHFADRGIKAGARPDRDS